MLRLATAVSTLALLSLAAPTPPTAPTPELILYPTHATIDTAATSLESGYITYSTSLTWTTVKTSKSPPSDLLAGLQWEQIRYFFSEPIKNGKVVVNFDTSSSAAHRAQPTAEIVECKATSGVVESFNKTHIVGTADAEGFLQTTVTLRVLSTEVVQRIHYLASLTSGDEIEGVQSHGVGIILLAVARGLTMLVDTDETIKLLGATADEAYESTFKQPFQPVPGASELITSIFTRATPKSDEDEFAGALIVYEPMVPWQLLPSLLVFLTTHGFPVGAVVVHRPQLSVASPSDEVGCKRLANEAWKFSNVPKQHEDSFNAMLKAMPQRSFILIGDSVASDPESYASVLKANKDIYASALIRRAEIKDAEVDKTQNSDERFKKAFEGINDESWVVFDEYSELSNMDTYEYVLHKPDVTDGGDLDATMDGKEEVHRATTAKSPVAKNDANGWLRPIKK